MRFKLMIVLTFLFSAVAAGDSLAPPYLLKGDFEPVWDREQKEVATVEPFQFVNQNNDTISEKSLENRITVVNFFFTSCGGICPMLMKKVKHVYSKLKGEGIQFVSFTITPDIDTPKKLTDYISANELPVKNWQLVTGPKDSLTSFSERVFQANQNNRSIPSKDTFIHSDQIYLIDHHLQFRGSYFGRSQAAIINLIDDARVLARAHKK